MNYNIIISDFFNIILLQHFQGMPCTRPKIPSGAAAPSACTPMHPHFIIIQCVNILIGNKRLRYFYQTFHPRLLQKIEKKGNLLHNWCDKNMPEGTFVAEYSVFTTTTKSRFFPWSNWSTISGLKLTYSRIWFPRVGWIVWFC